MRVRVYPDGFASLAREYELPPDLAARRYCTDAGLSTALDLLVEPADSAARSLPGWRDDGDGPRRLFRAHVDAVWQLREVPSFKRGHRGEPWEGGVDSGRNEHDLAVARRVLQGVTSASGAVLESFVYGAVRAGREGERGRILAILDEIDSEFGTPEARSLATATHAACCLTYEDGSPLPPRPAPPANDRPSDALLAALGSEVVWAGFIQYVDVSATPVPVAIVRRDGAHVPVYRSGGRHWYDAKLFGPRLRRLILTAWAESQQRRADVLDRALGAVYAVAARRSK